MRKQEAVSARFAPVPLSITVERCLRLALISVGVFLASCRLTVALVLTDLYSAGCKAEGWGQQALIEL